MESMGSLRQLIVQLAPYQLELKVGALVLGCLLAFLVGRLAQNNDLQRSLNKLNNSDYFKNELNKDLALTKLRIASLGKLSRILLGLVVAVVLLILVSFSKLAGEYLSTLYLLYFLAAFLSMWVLLLAYKKLLMRRQAKETKNLSNIFMEEDKEVDKVLKAIGTTLSDRLKSRLEAIERQTAQKNKKKECDLYQCRESKRLLKQAEQFFEKTVSELTTHKWCSKCAEQSAQQPFLKVDLSGLKTEGLQLQDLKRLFNRLLQIYNDKKKELDRSCTQECAKSFCQKLRMLNQAFFERTSYFQKRLTELKATR